MQSNGANQHQRGHVLLIAGDVVTRRRNVQVAPSANLAALSVLPIPVLLGSDVPSDTTYLDGIRDQNALQVRLRAAAATPGPLLIYLSGRLTTDRRGRNLYLALAGTTAATARYAAMPWEWLGTELRNRPPGLTTVLLDLAADKGAWPLLQEYGTLPAATTADVFGVIAPPGFSGPETVVSTYTRVWIEQLRHTPDRRPNNSRLHGLTVGTAALPPGALIIPSTPELAMAPAAESKTDRQRLSIRPRRRRPEVPREVAPGLDRMPDPPHYEHLPPQPQAPAPRPEPAPSAVPQPAPTQQDPRPHIHALSEAGQHRDAARLAQEWEHHALQTYGTGSPQATLWVEIRADLAKREGNYELATQLWVAAGRTRLAHQAADAPEVLAAAKSAHYCWRQMPDTHHARECGSELIKLLRALPALDHRHLSMAQQRQQFLQGTSGR